MRRLCAILTTLALSGCALAQASVHYIVSLANPEQHLVEVTVDLAPGRQSHQLQLPVWNALYQVRDFSQYMNWIRAKDVQGQALELKPLNKSRWQIMGTQNGARVEYQMFADNPGPYGAELNLHHAFFNLAEVLLYAEDSRSDPIRLEFRNVSSLWRIATPLAQQGNEYSADNYDQLVDSPVEIGTFEETDFAGRCGKYRVIVDADHAKEILIRIVPSLQRIVSAAATWMNDCPFQTYTFIYHFGNSPGGGGMEHTYSTAITLPRKDILENVERFTGITAHEFFHLWNVKRIRPQSLEPVDYTKENYTTALWFSEGVDSTVSEYIRLRAGLLNEQQYLKHLGEEITELANRPAHTTQSAEQSSEDAWLEKYPYYGLPQRSISYYNKGELLGVLLDLEMRDRSHNQTSLRELFRSMNDLYAKQGKYFADSKGVEEAAGMLTHTDFHDFFEKCVAGVGEIPWDNFFLPVGLRVIKSEVTLPDSGFDAVQQFDQPPTVVQVYVRSEAEGEGLAAGDVVAQINGHPAGRDFNKQIAKLVPGQTLRLVVRRDGIERELHWKLGSRKQSVYQLEDVPNITAQQKAMRADWLFGGAAR